MAADQGATPEAGHSAAPEGSPSPWAPLRASVFRAVEQFTVPSWDDHLRQHSGGPITGADQENLDRVRELSDPPPSVRHLFSL
jgi:hypothetical protein